MRMILLLSTALTLSACASKDTASTFADKDFKEAVVVPDPPKEVKVVERAKPLPLPGQLKKVDAKKTKSPEDEFDDPRMRVDEANAAAKLEPKKSGYINAIQVYPFTQGALYRLYTAVNQVSDISLQLGEKLQSVSAGDTVRWVVGDTTSGEGTAQQVHILVKPIAADLKTNLVITTDRRTYHLELESTDETYMSALSWTYPEDELFAISKRNEEAIGTTSIPVDGGVSFENLNFRYRIEGRAPWKPLRAFDDGSKVYIQFGDSLPKGEAPPLFVASSKGDPALVNYRVKNNTYIVDRLFAVAELRLGRDPQQIVRIVRTDAVQPKPRFNFLSDRSRR
ncbi:MAG: P-type conjugative transfer protein TrbG [Pseudomonadota bacterium]